MIRRTTILKILFMGVIFFPLLKELLFTNENTPLSSLYDTMNDTSTILLAISFHNMISLSKHLEGKLSRFNSFLGGTAFAFMVIIIIHPANNSTVIESNRNGDPGYLVLFFISIFYFFLVEFLKNINARYITVNVRDEYKIELSNFAGAFIRFGKRLRKPLLISTVSTFLLYKFVHYEDTFINHCSVFGVMLTIVQYVQNNEKK